MNLCGFWYRTFMRLAHRFDWHYAPVIGPLLPDGSYQRWCKWCGFRQSFWISLNGSVVFCEQENPDAPQT